MTPLNSSVFLGSIETGVLFEKDITEVAPQTLGGLVFFLSIDSQFLPENARAIMEYTLNNHPDFNSQHPQAAFIMAMDANNNPLLQQFRAVMLSRDLKNNIDSEASFSSKIRPRM